MKVVIISGPTATGKTDLSLQLASDFGGEIVNFDSLLLYKEITIGTAKPTIEERGKIPHHMIDISSISRPLNAADYAKLALPIIDQLLKEKKIVYLVGGSGFYLQAILRGMYDSPTTPKDILEKSDTLYRQEGITPFREILKKEDFLSFTRYHENDHYRIRRAVEHFWTTGTPLSLTRAKKDLENDQSNQMSIHGWDIHHVHLDVPKEEHFEIIKHRTKKMLTNGLIQEVESLLQSGFTGLEKPLQSIGYKEVLDLHFGLIKNLEDCQERIVISTRQLAKSQRTWFNRISGKVTYHPLLDTAKIAEDVSHFIQLKL